MSFIVDYNSFASKLYSLAKKKSGSFAISPYSVQAALSLALIASSGKLEEELKKLLCISDDVESKELKEYFEGGIQLGKENNVVVVNKLYYQNSSLDESLEELCKAFSTELEKVDFSNEEDTLNAINRWVAEKTNQAIVKFLDESITFNGQDVLVNTIHIQSRWNIGFDGDKLSKMDFKVDKKRTVQLDSLSGVRPIGYKHFEDLEAYGICYKCADDKFSMVFMMPEDEKGFDAMEKKLAAKDINKVADEMQVGNIIVDLPKFKFETLVDLSDTIREMGAPNLFSNPTDLKGLTISKVLHRVVVDVNEYGIGATQGTGHKMPLMCCPIGGSFNATRPFWFAVRQNRNILVTGRFMGQ